MEQFSLEKWLENKSRKVVTRDGRPVRIICWDKLDDRPAAKEQKIVALVKEGCKEIVFMYNDNGDGCISALDLFFADEEDELTEFDYAVLSIISDHNSHTDSIEAFAKRSSKKLLDLARKELLKDLPKWKKATEQKDLEKHIAILEEGKVLLSNYLEEGDYYIDLEDLKTLPKEE